jgi:hypothetical protein
LTTPDFWAVKVAAIILLAGFGILSAMAVNFRHRIEAGGVDWRSIYKDYGRNSVMAMAGAAQETDISAKNFVFVGPSSLRCWLPHPDEASALATSSSGKKVRVLSMCGGSQSYAVTAALVDRFGADFNGWFVIGVGRQTIGRKFTETELKTRRQQPRTLGFYSDALTPASEILGLPTDPITGLELWDHLDFHYRYKLGFKLRASKKRKPYEPFLEPTKVPVETWGSEINRLDADSLQRHLTVLELVVQSVRVHGCARVALVETPWVDTYTPAMQTAEWKRDEDAYQQMMQAWARRHDVPWLNNPASFKASTADFADAKHVGTPALRRQFLESVVRTLLAEPFPLPSHD